jgi:DNA-binding response OmpR family regulator
MGETSLNSPDLRESEDRQVCVLVVEDDAALQRMIVNYFLENNIHTLVACGRQEMVNQLAGTEVNLVILDLRLGQEDGLDLLREVRSSSDVPIIIITGHRRDDIDRVVGLELGADDYLTKPFNLRELLARVRAVLRRFDMGRAVPARDPEHGRFRSGDRGENSSERSRLAGIHTSAHASPEYSKTLSFLSTSPFLLTACNREAR